MRSFAGKEYQTECTRVGKYQRTVNLKKGYSKVHDVSAWQFVIPTTLLIFEAI